MALAPSPTTNMSLTSSQCADFLRAAQTALVHGIAHVSRQFERGSLPLNADDEMLTVVGRAAHYLGRVGINDRALVTDTLGCHLQNPRVRAAASGISPPVEQVTTMDPTEISMLFHREGADLLDTIRILCRGFTRKELSAIIFFEPIERGVPPYASLDGWLTLVSAYVAGTHTSSRALRIRREAEHTAPEKEPVHPVERQIPADLSFDDDNSEATAADFSITLAGQPK